MSHRPNAVAALRRAAEQMALYGQVELPVRGGYSRYTCSRYTCNIVATVLDWQGARNYCDLFMSIDESRELWSMPDKDKIRSLLLGFAAAMAETGDL